MNEKTPFFIHCRIMKIYTFQKSLSNELRQNAILKKLVELIENGEFKVSIVERYFAKKTAGEWARGTTT